jgi:hypothetical protein
MDEGGQDRADRIGMHISTVFIFLLGVMFAYGYLSHLING